jgi:hypothetical protein
MRDGVARKPRLILCKERGIRYNVVYDHNDRQRRSKASAALKLVCPDMLP